MAARPPSVLGEHPSFVFDPAALFEWLKTMPCCDGWGLFHVGVIVETETSEQTGGDRDDAGSPRRQA